MIDDPNEKLKAEYVDEREDKSAWFLEVKERAKLNPSNCVEHYAPNKAAMALWLAAQRYTGDKAQGILDEIRDCSSGLHGFAI